MCTSTFPLLEYTGKTQSFLVFIMWLKPRPRWYTNSTLFTSKDSVRDQHSLHRQKYEAAAPDSWEIFLSPSPDKTHFKREKKQKEVFQGSHVHSFHFTAGLFRRDWDLQGRNHYGRSHQLPQRAGSSLHDLQEHHYREVFTTGKCLTLQILAQK